MPFGGSADASAAQSSMQESPDQSMTHSASLENSQTGPSTSAYVGPRHPYASSSSAEPDEERHYHHNASSGSQRIFDSIHKSPRAEEDPASSANASHSSPSPNVSLSPQDRTNLVGLGELATPKWDSTSSDRYHWLSHMTASSSGSPQEPHTLPSLVPFESPLAFSGSPQQSGMPNSSSLLSLAEASALGAKTAPSSSSSGSERPAPSSSNDSPVSKSGSAAMSAIDHLLGEFEGNEAASADNSAFDGRQSSSRHPSRHQHHALPQLPSKNTESSSNNNSQRKSISIDSNSLLSCRSLMCCHRWHRHARSRCWHRAAFSRHACSTARAFWTPFAASSLIIAASSTKGPVVLFLRPQPGFAAGLDACQDRLSQQQCASSKIG